MAIFADFASLNDHVDQSTTMSNQQTEKIDRLLARIKTKQLLRSRNWIFITTLLHNGHFDSSGLKNCSLRVAWSRIKKLFLTSKLVSMILRTGFSLGKGTTVDNGWEYAVTTQWEPLLQLIFIIRSRSF